VWGRELGTNELDKQLSEWAGRLKGESQKLLQKRLLSLKSVFPFNEYEYRLMFLLDKGVISFDEYETLRGNYAATRPYLELYEIGPRRFGDIWAREHLRDIDSRFELPDKSLDPTYQGEYDLWLQGTKVEAKASRATDTKAIGKVVAKALRYGDPAAFWMNFQQIKLDTCDVFVFIGVWVDKICYWVLSSADARAHPSLSHQHRGGVEYQIGVTQQNLRQFDKYLAEPTQLANAILLKRPRSV
jgi:hypothetical protein